MEFGSPVWGTPMKVVVAKRQTQGVRDNDFSWTIDGELVLLGLALHDDTDGPCGCARAFAGMSLHRATTTGLVADLELTPAQVRLACEESLGQQGYLAHVAGTEQAVWVDSLAKGVLHMAEGVLHMADGIGVGTVVEYRDGIVRPRTG